MVLPISQEEIKIMNANITIYKEEITKELSNIMGVEVIPMEWTDNRIGWRYYEVETDKCTVEVNCFMPTSSSIQTKVLYNSVTRYFKEDDGFLKEQVDKQRKIRLMPNTEYKKMEKVLSKYYNK